MENKVRALFQRYEGFFNRALHGDVDLEELASLYSAEFVGAGPAGVRTGKNDDQFRGAMAQGYDHYRAVGTKEMRIRNIRLSAIDELHCVAHVAWVGTYIRKERPDATIAFDVHYLVQMLNGEPRVFGWVSGDEQALLKRHGIV
ncbi:nuclear transport factor 2 family protein [Paenirhodobacter sp.]|uniref:nuclear transport factor 2 family protein n=1 Tax=Paenirhodobacter sp. TaxID=1965326 RepID=UPI003B3C9184